MSATSSGRCASAATMIDHSFRPTFAAPAGVQADAFATRGLLGASAVADALGDQRDRATRIRRPSGAWRCGTGRPGVAQHLALVDREHLPAARQIAARMASWTVRLRTSRSRCATITPSASAATAPRAQARPARSTAWVVPDTPSSVTGDLHDVVAVRVEPGADLRAACPCQVPDAQMRDERSAVADASSPRARRPEGAGVPQEAPDAPLEGSGCMGSPSAAKIA